MYTGTLEHYDQMVRPCRGGAKGELQEAVKGGDGGAHDELVRGGLVVHLGVAAQVEFESKF